MSEEKVDYGFMSGEPEYRLLARLIYGEARGEPVQGRIAVACVVRNRVRRPSWWGRTWREVMLKPYQFSCFNPGDPNFRVVLTVSENDPLFRECVWIAQGVILGILQDNTDGATHYHRWDRSPKWGRRMKATVTIGNHVFKRARE